MAKVRFYEKGIEYSAEIQLVQCGNDVIIRAIDNNKPRNLAMIKIIRPDHLQIIGI